MTTTEDREARLAALQADDPPTPESELNALTELRSQLSALKISVEQLSAAQNATTAAVNVLVSSAATTSASPTDSETPDKLDSLAATSKKLIPKIDAVGVMVAELKSRLEPQSEIALSQTQLDAMAAMVTEAVAEKVGELTPRLNSKKVAELVAESVGDAVADRTAERAQEVVDALNTAERGLKDSAEKADGIATAMTVAGVGRVALAMTPIAVVAAMLVLLAVPVAEVLGIGPLSRWAWDSFEAADSAGTRAWIAALTLAVIGAVGFGIFKAGQSLASVYRSYR